MKKILFIITTLLILFCACEKEPTQQPAYSSHDIYYIDFVVPHTDCVIFNDMTFFKEISYNHLTLKTRGFFVTRNDTSQVIALMKDTCTYFEHILNDKTYDYYIYHRMENDTSYLQGDYRITK